LRHEILYQPSFSLAVVHLERGEQIMAESGAMVSMSPTIKLEAQMSGGGVMGAFKSALGGESLFRTTFTAESGPGEVTLAPGSVGDIMAVQLGGGGLFVQPGSYLAGDPRLTIGVQGSMRGMLSGEGLFLLSIQGSGLLLVSSFGAIHAKDLAVGEEYIVDTGHIVAFDGSVQYRIEKAVGPRGLRVPLPRPGTDLHPDPPAPELRAAAHAVHAEARDGWLSDSPPRAGRRCDRCPTLPPAIGLRLPWLRCCRWRWRRSSA
jgi:uncharacterized protein (TIGR00266 family)